MPITTLDEKTAPVAMDSPICRRTSSNAPTSCEPTPRGDITNIVLCGIPTNIGVDDVLAKL